MAAVVIVLL